MSHTIRIETTSNSRQLRDDVRKARQMAEREFRRELGFRRARHMLGFQLDATGMYRNGAKIK